MVNHEQTSPRPAGTPLTKQAVREWVTTGVMVSAVLLTVGAAYYRLQRVEADLAKEVDRHTASVDSINKHFDRITDEEDKRFEQLRQADNTAAIQQARIETKLAGIETMLIEVRNDIRLTHKVPDSKP